MAVPAERPAASTAFPWTTVLLGLAAVLVWDASGLDLPLAQLVGHASGFPWQFHPLLTNVFHEAARTLGWVVLWAVTLLAIWPVSPFKSLSTRERRGWAGSIWVALLVVVVLKGISHTSCPWDLEVFGGSAQHISHWLWGQRDGGPGHCFPAGHASTGFAFVTAHFWLKARHPALAQRWMWVALAAGAVLGLSQQLRGAHFMSHTLWTAWLCWTLGAMMWHFFRQTNTQHKILAE